MNLYSTHKEKLAYYARCLKHYGFMKTFVWQFIPEALGGTGSLLDPKYLVTKS